MRIFGTFIPDSLSEALGWTLLHSLWQATIIGLIAWVIFKSRKQASPQFKYLVGTVSMLAVLVSSVLTFILEYQPGSSVLMTSTLPLSETIRDSFVSISSVRSSLTLPDIFPLLSTVWMIGVFVLSVRLAGGIALVVRLRNDKISPMPESWKSRIDFLLHKSGLRRTIEIVLSGKVRIPTVIGVLRPMVLIPAGIISLMPVDQLEAILAHEIAHIRRYDFLINIVQSLIEALFFYHPVVWLLSRSVRQEREKCCDDYAVSICGKLSIYARALAGLSEIQTRTFIPSVALSGNKNRIIIRVERLLKQQKMKNNASEKIIAGLLILGSAMILTFSTGASPGNPQKQEGASPKFNLQVFEKNSLVEGEEAEASYPAEPDLPLEPGFQAESDIHAESFLLAESGLQVEAAVSDEAGVSSVASLSEELLFAAETSLRAEPSRLTGVSRRAEPGIPWNIHKGDSTMEPSRNKMDIKDNIVSRVFINQNGEEMKMKFTIRDGKVKELYVNETRVPQSEYPRYDKEIKRTLGDLKDMETDLQKAKQEMENFDYEKIQAQVQAEMERFREEDMIKLQEEMKKFQEQQFDLQIDQKAMQEEIQKAMQEVQINKEEIQKEVMKAQEEARKAMEEFQSGAHELGENEMREMELAIAEAMKQLEAINQDELMENLEKGLQAIRLDFDAEKMQKEIELAMKSVDFEKIEREMAEAMKNMEKEVLQIDKQKLHLAGELKSIDELLEELEKLELEKK